MELTPFRARITALTLYVAILTRVPLNKREFGIRHNSRLNDRRNKNPEDLTMSGFYNYKIRAGFGQLF